MSYKKTLRNMIKDQIKRCPVRNFKDKKIEKTKIEQLKKVINNSPTAKNFQCFSAIFVTDPKIKEKLRLANYQQKHINEAPLIIVFCADMNRYDICTGIKSHDLKNYTWAMTDAVIACTTCMDACAELGLGTCLMGGLRFNASQVKKALGLSGAIIPALGICVGYPSKPSIHRPKVNKVYDNKYSLSNLKKELNEYDKVMAKYYKKVFNKDTTFKRITKASIDKYDQSKDLKMLKQEFKLK